jgi:hypothetical protein
MDRERLRELIRHKLNNGDLPTAAPTEIQVSHGSGATCSACDDPIASSQSEHQLNYPGGRCIRLHFNCTAVWEMQRRERGFDPTF